LNVTTPRRTWAWYGDEDLYCFADSGELTEHKTFAELGLTWSLQHLEMRALVKAAILRLIPDPGYFQRRQRELMAAHWKQDDCNLENL
jgi:hypothetical protein